MTSKSREPDEISPTADKPIQQSNVRLRSPRASLAAGVPYHGRHLAPPPGMMFRTTSSARAAEQAQGLPAQTLPTQYYTSTDQISDYRQRQTVQRIRLILPHVSIDTCMEAIHTTSSNFEEAMDQLIDHEEGDDAATAERPQTLHFRDPEIDRIKDYGQRQTVKRIKAILPHVPVATCLEALRRAKGNYEDGMQWLADHENDKEAESELEPVLMRTSSKNNKTAVKKEEVDQSCS